MPKKDKDGNYAPGEFERVMGQLGLPKDSAEYKTSANFKLPDGITLDDKFTTEFKASCHRAGLLPNQYAFVMDKLAETLQQGAKGQREAAEKAFNEGTLNLRTKWGADYETKAAMANRALQEFMSEDKAADFVKKYGNDPLVIEFAANISENLSEEVLSRTNMSGNMMTPDAAKAEIEKLKAEHLTELTRDDHPQHAFYQKKMDELYVQAYRKG